MSAGVRLRFKHDDVTRALRQLARSTPAAAARTINKTLLQVRTVAVREIRTKLRKVRARTVRGTMRIRRAANRNPSGALQSLGTPISLKEYGAREVRGRGRRRKNQRGRRRSKGVQVQVTPGSKSLLRRAFIGPGGHVFERRGSARLPLRKLFGPSIPTAMARSVVRQAMDDKAVDAIPRIGRHELQREIDRAGLRAR